MIKSKVDILRFATESIKNIIVSKKWQGIDSGIDSGAENRFWNRFQNLWNRTPLVYSQRFESRTFSEMAPAVWNSFPYEMRSSVLLSEASFKRKLKTFLMRNYLED